MAAVQIDTKTQRFASGPQPEPDVVVEHTTEVMAWPPYASGGEAPHATIWPDPGKGIRVREHIPFTQYAKALMNLPGGVETNRRGVIQFELVGTCDPSKRGKPGWYFWPDADDTVLKALADYQRPIMQRYRIPFTGPAFLPYPDSYGNRNGQRMSGAQWNAFHGVCGHQHVPENDHGDPGAFPIARFLQFLRGAPTVQEDDMPTVQELWTGTPVVKNVTAKNPDTAPRVAPSFLLELAAKNSVTTVAQLAGLTAAVKALAESKPGVDPAALLATVEKAVDAGVTAALADLSITLSNNPGA